VTFAVKEGKRTHIIETAGLVIWNRAKKVRNRRKEDI
jgi:hypothetical protein